MQSEGMGMNFISKRVKRFKGGGFKFLNLIVTVDAITTTSNDAIKESELLNF